MSEVIYIFHSHALKKNLSMVGLAKNLFLETSKDCLLALKQKLDSKKTFFLWGLYCFSYHTDTGIVSEDLEHLYILGTYL